MGLRTAAQVEAEYTAVRAAYLKALDAESYSVDSGGVSRSVNRTSSASLLKQMKALEREYNRMTNSGLRIYSVTPE